MHPPLRIVVLLSGNGRTLQNLLDRIADGTLAAQIALVISDREKAYGLIRAKNAGIESTVTADSGRIFTLCRETQVDLVCMAGFLRLLEIPPDFEGRVLNIHPSLLPAFGGLGMYGMHVHEAVLKSGAKESGCTVHIADDLYDHGRILMQKRVSVLSTDTPQTLAERVFEAECEAYPEAIQIWAMSCR